MCLFFFFNLLLHLCASCVSGGKGLTLAGKEGSAAFLSLAGAGQENLGVYTEKANAGLGGGPVRRGLQEGQMMPPTDSFHRLRAAV